MECQISNLNLKVRINQTGAELCSIVSQASGREFVWNANPDIWGSSAPVLFPIVGGLKNGQTSHNGKLYSMPRHGIVRHNSNIHVIAQEHDRITFRLTADEQTLEHYPFRFTFDINYRVKDNSLIITHTVKNTDDCDIYFSVGAHPAFNCPINEGESYTDCYLEFSERETLSTSPLTKDGLVKDESIPVLTDSNILPLTEHLFDNDALIFRNLKSHCVTLRSHKSDTAVAVEFPDFNYLGIWAKPNAPFVCIEPWLGIADSENGDGILEHKEAIIKLPVGQKSEAKYSIKIIE
ncbi:MAG: aldose 1-epimerase family protein [Salinivirgaceae bacterium]|nr:aldose 1-epimerase family protein [Salinivirgaceae bacterium]